MTVLHSLGCGRTDDQRIEDASNENGSKWHKNGPSIAIHQKATPADVFSDVLASNTEQLFSRISDHESQAKDRLKGEEDREGSFLQSRELGSWKHFERDNATDKGLEERGSEERAITQDVIRFVVRYGRHVCWSIFGGWQRSGSRDLPNGISRQIA